MHVYSIRAFHSLIEIMSKLGHVHLVPLIGYCHEQEMTLMVYEYVAGENLGEHLYGTRKQSLKGRIVSPESPPETIPGRNR